MLGWFHEAPQPACTCGLHGTHDLDLLRRTRCPAVTRARRALGPGHRTRVGVPRALRLSATPSADLSVLLLAVGVARGTRRRSWAGSSGETCSRCATSTPRWPAATGCALRRGCRWTRSTSASATRTRSTRCRASVASGRASGRRRRRDAPALRIGAPDQPAPQLAAVDGRDRRTVVDRRGLVLRLGLGSTWIVASAPRRPCRSRCRSLGARLRVRVARREARDRERGLAAASSSRRSASRARSSAALRRSSRAAIAPESTPVGGAPCGPGPSSRSRTPRLVLELAVPSLVDGLGTAGAQHRPLGLRPFELLLELLDLRLGVGGHRSLGRSGSSRPRPGSAGAPPRPSAPAREPDRAGPAATSPPPRAPARSLHARAGRAAPPPAPPPARREGPVPPRRLGELRLHLRRDLWRRLGAGAAGASSDRCWANRSCSVVTRSCASISVTRDCSCETRDSAPRAWASSWSVRLQPFHLGGVVPARLAPELACCSTRLRGRGASPARPAAPNAPWPSARAP